MTDILYDYYIVYFRNITDILYDYYIVYFSYMYMYITSTLCL